MVFGAISSHWSLKSCNSQHACTTGGDKQRGVQIFTNRFIANLRYGNTRNNRTHSVVLRNDAASC